MKIGIVTINDDNNYGNRLQNYAVQEFCKKVSQAEIFTVKNDIRLNNKENIFKYFLKYLLMVTNEIKKKISKNERLKLFEEFNKNIKFNKKTLNWFTNYSKIGDSADYFIVGSDQVWNPYGRMTDVDLLEFTTKNKISFAASMSVSELKEKHLERIKNSVTKFKKISVREYAGKEIINKTIKGCVVDVIVDPTMLISEQEWDKVAKKPKQLINKKYILNYFLGNLSETRKKEIERIAKENECEIINILDTNSEFYQTGPSEFLYLEKNAFLICTDSFHSSVFAILYDRPFIVFDREDRIVSMNSRIETLIHKFKLKNRKFEGKITEENLNHDYTEAYKILKDEREKASNFLKEALDLK